MCILERSRGWVGVGLLLAAAALPACGQVFTVGEKTATADMATDFKPTRVELPDGKLTERGRRELVRDLEAEQGFAHRVLPLASSVTLQANGTMTPGSEGYRKLVYQKGQSAGIGDRVAVTALDFKPDRILVDLNGGPYPRHRFMRHVQIGMGPAVTGGNLNDGQEATGTRVVLVFEGGVPELSAPQVKALLYPLVDFGVKSGDLAYAETLPAPIKGAIDSHEVLVGMNRRMVLASLGAPESKVRETDAEGMKYEDWIYGHQPQTMKFVRFEGDRVALVKIAEMGKPMEIRDQDEMAGYAAPKPGKAIVNGDPQPVHGDAQPDASESARQVGPPSLKRPGEALPDEGAGGPQNGRVQYPVEKTRPVAVEPSSMPPPLSQPSTPPAPSSTPQ